MNIPTSQPLSGSRFSDAAAAGHRVFPVKPAGKEPAIAWKEFVERAPTTEELAHWNASDFNVGVITGEPSDIAVLDVDSAEAQEFVDALDLPPTPRLTTGRGTHFYFRLPQGGVRNATNIAGHKLDLRGDGGYVVGDGSIHPSGLRYTWEIGPDEVPFAEFPLQLLELVKSKARVRTNHSKQSAGHEPDVAENRYADWLDRRINEACASIRSTEEGGRNNALFQVAVRLAEDVAAAGADWSGFAAPLVEAAQTSGLDAHEAGRTVESAWRAGSENPTSWITLSREWIFNSGSEVFWHLESRASLKPSGFKAEFGKLNPAKKQALTTFLTSNGYVEVVQGIAYEPQQSLGIFELNGRKWFNAFEPSQIVAEEGDATPFVAYLRYLVPDDEERDHLLKMIAHLVRNPGEKLTHALLLSSRVHGVGKSTLTDIMTQLIGPRNCRKATSDEIDGQYQSFLEGKLLVVVEELNIRQGLRTYNKLKDWITGLVSPIRKLYEDTRDVTNSATFVFLTNLSLPLLIEPSDRRFFVIESPAELRDPDYWVGLHEWIGRSLGVIRHHLDQVDLSDFKRFAPPPVTKAKEKLIARSRNPISQDLMEMIESRAMPFHLDIVTRNQVQDALKGRNPLIKRNEVDRALEDLKCIPLGQHRLPKGTVLKGQFFQTSDRENFWVIRHNAYWLEASASERVDEFLAHKSALAEFAEWPETIGVLHRNSLKRSGIDPSAFFDMSTRADCPGGDVAESDAHDHLGGEGMVDKEGAS